MAQQESRTDELIASLRGRYDVIADACEPVFRERPTMEHVLLLLFLVTGIYMYWGAREFSRAAGEFPRLMAGLTALLAFLILARNYLNVVAPILLAGLGVHSLYVGSMAFLEDGGGLFRLAFGVGLLIAVIWFREDLITTAEEFVAEPMQVLGEEDILISDEERDELSEEQRRERGEETEAEERTGAGSGHEQETSDTDAGLDDDEGEVTATADDHATDEGEVTATADDHATDEGEVTATDDEEVTTTDDEEGSSGAMYTYDIDDPKGPVVTGLLCLGYMVLAFTIGMLYATPLFVIAWALWVRMDLLRTVGLTLLAFVCAFLFYDLIQSDISEGWLTGWEPTPPDELLEPVTDAVRDALSPVLGWLSDLLVMSHSVLAEVVALGVVPG